MNTQSKGESFLLSQRPQEYLQAFSINSEHFVEFLPLFPQLLPKITAFVQSLNHSPAKFHLLSPLYAESEVSFQFAHVGCMQEGKSALQVCRRDLLDEF
jgi:hypothetical protein